MKLWRGHRTTPCIVQKPRCPKTCGGKNPEVSKVLGAQTPGGVQRPGCPKAWGASPCSRTAWRRSSQRYVSTIMSVTHSVLPLWGLTLRKAIVGNHVPGYALVISYMAPGPQSVGDNSSGTRREVCRQIYSKPLCPS